VTKVTTEDVDIYEIDNGTGWVQVSKGEVYRLIAGLFIHPRQEIEAVEAGRVVERPGFKFRKMELRCVTNDGQD